MARNKKPIAKIKIPKKMGPYISGPIMCKVIEVKSPYNGVFRGWRLLATKQNMEGRAANNKLYPLFRAPYRVRLWGDWAEPPTEAKRSAFTNHLLKWGATEVIWLN